MLRLQGIGVANVLSSWIVILQIFDRVFSKISGDDDKHNKSSFSMDGEETNFCSVNPLCNLGLLDITKPEMQTV